MVFLQILEYFAINFPNKVLSYSRGSQVWNYIEPEWELLAPDICVGPPHKIMTVYEQLRLLLFSVIHFKKPLELLSDSFELKAKRAKKEQIYTIDILISNINHNCHIKNTQKNLNIHLFKVVFTPR